MLAPLIVLALAAGCAKSPSGGPLAPGAADTLTVTMTTQQPPEAGFFYAWAFDDTGGAQTATGPGAIVGSSPTTNNHIVTGNFDILVTYENGAFNAYRRTDLSGGTDGPESLDQCTRAFVTQPVVSGSTFNFTLDMDAKTNSGAALFQFPATANRQKLNTNFVTTNSLLAIPGDNRQKYYDAFYAGQPDEWYDFDVTTTNTYTNAGTVGEPPNDVHQGDVSFGLGANDVASLDITDFTISVARAAAGTATAPTATPAPTPAP
jgi:hypothetical protein